MIIIVFIIMIIKILLIGVLLMHYNIPIHSIVIDKNANNNNRSMNAKNNNRPMDANLFFQPMQQDYDENMNEYIGKSDNNLYNYVVDPEIKYIHNNDECYRSSLLNSNDFGLSLHNCDINIPRNMMIGHIIDSNDNFLPKKY